MSGSSFPPPLGCVLLGLLNREPMSGYELTRIFETTPLGGFSSSPGAIYPALKRLESATLIDELSGGATRGARWTTTQAGRRALEDWLRQPIGEDDVERRLPEVMARFVFAGDVLPDEERAWFMSDMSAAIAARLRALAHASDAYGLALRPHDRWAVEASRMELEALSAWTSRAVRGLGLTTSPRRPR